MLGTSALDFLQNVQALMGAPAHSNPDLAQFDELESGLGLEFPEAYKAFVCAYGPGSICDDVNVYHPTIPYPPFGVLGDVVEGAVRIWTADPYFWDGVSEGGEPPFEVGPTLRGLVPWADALNQVTLYLVVSKAQNWEVIEYSGGEHERSGLIFSQWILRYLNGGGSSGYFVTPKPRNRPPFYNPAAPVSY